jgi:hypothetical protein
MFPLLKPFLNADPYLWNLSLINIIIFFFIILFYLYFVKFSSELIKNRKQTEKTRVGILQEILDAVKEFGGDVTDR